MRHHQRDTTAAWLAVLTVAAFALPAAADWPAYRHDNRRSGLTEETLEFPLATAWVRTSAAPPAPSWHGPAQADYFHRKFELHALDDYDTAFHPVAAAGRVYYGSSASDTLYCADAATGETLWQLTTEGPIRLAPTLAAGRVYVGSDDGNLYCANAETGEVEWTYSVSDVDRRLPGNGRMISRWPIRCGVAVEGGNVYFAAGVFPSAGLYLCAVEATSGEEVWKQEIDKPIRGHLVASETRLYATAGRSGCEVYDITNGNRIAGFGGGAFAVLVDPATEKVVAGPDESGGVTGLEGGVRDKVASVQGLQLVARGEEYFVSTAEMIAAVTAARELRWKVEDTATYALALVGDALLAGGEGQVTAYNAADGTVLWQAEIEGRARALAIDTGRLYVGTDLGTLYCFAAEGVAGAEPNLTADTPGDASAFAEHATAGSYAELAEDLLTAATSEKVVPELVPDGQDSPEPDFNSRQGYCLVVDCGEGNLVYELARQSKLQVIGVERDAAKVATARERLHAAGLHGQATIHLATGDSLPYQGRTFNIVVCDRLSAPGELPSYSAASVHDLLRPYGGVLLVAAEGSDMPIESWAAESNAPEMLLARTPATLQGAEASGLAAGDEERIEYSVYIYRSGPPAGSGEWTHQYADAGNTACSGDELVLAPFELQWYGEPGPENMVDRHNRTGAPVFVDGRLYVIGTNHLTGVDAYNGTILFEREVPDSLRLAVSKDSSNLAASPEAVYVAAGEKCLALDPLTGETLHEFAIGEFDDELTRRWGYLAWQGDMLIGTATRREDTRTTLTPDSWTIGYLDNSGIVCSDELYGFRREPSPGEGESPLWSYQPEQGVILSPTIALAEGRVYFVESTSPASREVESGRAGLPLLVADGAKLVALDAETGEVVLEQEIDIARLQHSIFLSVSEGLVLVSGSKNEGSVMRYEFSAFDAQNGELVWNATPPVDQGVGGSHGEQDQHPAVVGDTIYTRTFACNLHTGELIAGWSAPGGCSTISTSLNGAFFRASVPTMAPFGGGASVPLTMHTRPGCWINIIPAGGLVLAPEASAGCTCGHYGLQTSLALAPVACRPPTIELLDSSALPPPANDHFAGQLKIEITPPNSQVAVHYTLDGSDPTPLSPRYDAPLVLEALTTLTARSFTSSGLGSPAVSRTFTRIDQPRFLRLPGPFVAMGRAELERSYGSAEIRYTLDGTPPTAESPVYTAPLEFEDTTTVTAALFEGETRLGDDITGAFEKVEGLLPVEREDLVAGLNYEYYEGEGWERLPNFDELEPIETGQTGEFTLQIPHRADQFAVRYTGYLEVPQDGFFSFTLQSDDGSRLLIGETEVVNNDGLHDARGGHKGRIALAAGKHPITVEYFDGGLGESLFVYYEGPGIYARPLVPGRVLWREQ